MATFTSSVAGSAAGPNGTKSWNVSEADYQKCIDYLVFKYTPRDTQIAPTRGQALITYQQQTIDALWRETKRWMDETQRAAIDNPPPIFT